MPWLFSSPTVSVSPSAAVTAVLALESGESVGGMSLQSKSSGDEVRGGSKAGSFSSIPLQHYTASCWNSGNFVEWIGQTHLVSFYIWKGAKSFKVKVAVALRQLNDAEGMCGWMNWFPSDCAHCCLLGCCGAGSTAYQVSTLQIPHKLREPQLFTWHIASQLKDICQESPWWSSGWESACQCRGPGFNLWSGKIPHAMGQLNPWATTIEPAL